MKKNYLFTLILTLSFSLLSFGQSAVVTGYLDSTCASQAGRTLEIYVDGTINFDGWSIVRQSNGGGFDPGSATIDISSLGSVTDAFVYLTNSSTAIDTEFGITTNIIESSNINGNGDDGWQIVNSSSVVIDRFGVDGEDASGKDWEHLDSYAYRKDGATPNAGSFDSANWTFGAVNLLDGNCGSFASFVPFGSYKATASTEPSVSFVTPSDNQVFSSDVEKVNIMLSVDNFTLSGDNGSEESDGLGDGYIKGLSTKNGQPDGDPVKIFSLDAGDFDLEPGSSYTLTAELVDNGGNSLNPKVETSIAFSVDLPCDIQLGDITTVCDDSTSGIDTFDTTIAFTMGNTAAYTISAKDNNDNNVGTIGGDDPSTSESGNITISDVPEGTSFTVSVIGGAGSSCDLTRNISSPTCVSLPIYEPFDYVADTDLIAQPNWQNASNSTDEVRVVESDGGGFLILDSFYGQNELPDFTGNMVSFSGIGSDPYIGFSDVNSGVVYASFTFHVTDMANFSNTNGGYFAVFTEGGSFESRLWLRDPDAGTQDAGFVYNLGLSTGSTATMYNDFTANLAEPVFVVIGYDLDNDETKMWVVPDGSSFGTNTPPSANLTISGADAGIINRFLIRQDSSSETPSIDFDELRLGASWADVTSNPTALVNNNSLEGFTTYPNPVLGNQFTIKSNSNEKKEVSIFNVIGKRVLSTSVVGTKSNIDVSSISSGLYILKVTEGNKTATSKLVIK